MKRFKYIILSIFSLATLFSCSDTEDIRNDIDNLNARLAQLEAQMPQVNENIALYQGLINDKYMIVGYAEDKDGDYILDLSNGESFEVNVHAGGQPTISIGEDGYWYYTYNNGVAQLLADENGNPVSATLVPQFKVDANGYWQYSFGDDVWLGGIGEADPNKTFGSVFSEVEFKDDKLILTWSSNGQTLTKEIPLFEGLYLTIPDLTDVTEPVQFSVGQTYTWTIEQGPKVEIIVIETIDWTIKVEETSMTVTAPKKNLMESDYVDKLVLKIFSKEGYCRAVTIPVKLLNSIIDENSATAWQNFLLKNEWNVLLDYSYAGYMHGKVAPPDGFALGYEVVNVKEYMDSKNLSAREAFIEILNENRLVRINGNTTNSNSNVRKVFYFPAGEYDMQPSGITDLFPEIYGGNFVIKGDGEGKTKIFMNSYIYNNKTAPLFLIKHTQSPTNIDNSKELAKITANVSKGSFSVNVSSTVGLSPDKWVQLRLRSANNDLLQKELGPIYSQKKDIWSITQQPGLTGDKNNNEDGKGVNIMEFHQIKSISGNTVTFYEPIMSDIDISYNDYDGGWIIRDYKYFENVGVENLTFVGNAVTPYYHHGEGATDSSIPEWMYDNGYMPLQFGRLINSWVRNVTFESVSEAMTFGESANCSAYNITIKGNRGHSAVRAQGSSRVFIGKVIDESSDTRGHGQWHGCGVSKPSIGTVIWNSNWGKDACFESHATQPRATLFDNCSGGLVRYHAGGAESENPNHLRDLTIWNLYVTGTIDEKNQNWSNDFQWWDATTVWWKIYPPILVGVHGTSITWDKGTDDAKQYTYEESTGTKVTPESLYEEQLRNRLGYLPAWLNALK